MRYFFHRPALLVCVLWAAGSIAAAEAKSVAANPVDWTRVGGPSVVTKATKTTKTAKTTQKRSTKVKQAVPPERMPNGETVTNRERRLLRECKGRPNAGACLGYAS